MAGGCYVNFFTDFGFKRLFGSEPNKDILLDFLNALLKQDTGKIESIEFMNNEQLGRSPEDRRAIFDLKCRSEDGTIFIVELQRTKQKYFKDRALYYVTFPIVEQAQKGRNRSSDGSWDFRLNPIYVVAILDFIFDETKNSPRYRHNISLREDTGEEFYDKLRFVYLEMPKFNKQESELKGQLERWMFAIKNLSKLTSIPKKFSAAVFKKFFKSAKLANLTPQEHDAYEDSLKVYSDLKNSLDTSYDEGKTEGKHEQAIETALAMLSDGEPWEKIARYSGLPLPEVQKLATR